MHELPELIIHPGFPKSAFSSLQMSFVVDDHALAKQFRVYLIGKKFLPMNGYPPVAELMYQRDQCLEQLKSRTYAPGKYFFRAKQWLMTFSLQKSFLMYLILRKWFSLSDFHLNRLCQAIDLVDG